MRDPEDHDAILVLLITPHSDHGDSIEALLRSAGDHWFSVRRVTPGDGDEPMPCDVALFESAGSPDLSALRDAVDRYDAPFVVIGDEDDDILAARAVGLGAQDYLVMGTFAVDGLLRSLRYAIVRHRLMAERRHAEQALRDSRARYRRFFEEDLTGDVVASPEGRIVECNPAFATMFGFESPAAAKNVHLRELFSGSDLRDLVEGVRDRGRLQRFEVAARRRDGASLILVGNAIASRGADGRVQDIHAYFMDDTERRRTQEQLVQSQKMEAVGRLAGGIAHDFSNILTAITFHAEYLLATLEPDSPLRRRVEFIREAREQAASLTSQLLAISRRRVLSPRSLDLNSQVRTATAMFRRVIGENIRIETHLDSEIGAVRFDPGQLQQVVLNLVLNARDAMPKGGTLELVTRPAEADGVAEELGPSNAYIELRVRDTGVGIDAETRRNIFEPFFTTKERGQGMGLGLSTVYGIMKQSGGHIAVASEPGRGTTFRVFLPRAEGEAARDSARQDTASLESPSRDLETVVGGTEGILIVEDDEALGQLTLEALELQGYHGWVARSGREALHLVESPEAEIDLAIVDMVIPDMPGTELVGQIADRRPDLRFLMTSGHLERSTLVDGARQVQIPFLPKPFTTAVLTEKVREALEIGGTSGSGALSAGGW
ncbi:MAG: ATP-binding protein [Acidobacteriota bacterium]